VKLVIACEEDHYAVDLLDLLAGFAAQLDDKMWRFSMKLANIECVCVSYKSCVF